MVWVNELIIPYIDLICFKNCIFQLFNNFVTTFISMASTSNNDGNADVWVTSNSDHDLSGSTCKEWYSNFKNTNFFYGKQRIYGVNKAIWRSRLWIINQWKYISSIKRIVSNIKYWLIKCWNWETRIIFVSNCYWRYEVDVLR